MYKLLYKCITVIVSHKMIHLQTVMSKCARFAPIAAMSFSEKSFRYTQTMPN